MSQRPSENARLLDLMADAAITGLDARDSAELASLLEGHTADLLAFERAAAAADAALTGPAPDPMPDHVRRRADATLRALMRGVPVQGAAEAAQLRLSTATDDAPLPARAAPAPTQASLPPRADTAATLSWVPWLLAAACLGLAMSVWFPRAASTSTATPPDTIAQLKAAPGTLAINWKPLEDPTCNKCAGEVIWNNELQRGVMTFKGLATNDPTIEQYQLWIFDKNQKHPVDGGVFDIASASISPTGEITVPIVAKIRVSDPSAFAVTIEKPGGVVVSEQKRIAVLAPVSKG